MNALKERAKNKSQPTASELIQIIKADAGIEVRAEYASPLVDFRVEPRNKNEWPALNEFATNYHHFIWNNDIKWPSINAGRFHYAGAPWATPDLDTNKIPP